MKLGDAEYVALVQRMLDEGKCVSKSQARRIANLTAEKDMHKVTTLTESECTQEVKEITEGAFEQPLFAPGATVKMANGNQVVFVGPPDEISGHKDAVVLAEPKRKRGRPVGSKNKPKVLKV